MKARSTAVAFIVCLNGLACFRTVDPAKVRCTTSDHCPSDYFCSAGVCISRSVDAPPAGPGDTGLGPTVDSPAADSSPAGVDAAGPHVDGAFDTTSADLASDRSSLDAKDAPLPGTGGVGGAGGGGTIGTGGVLGSGGNGPGAGGVLGSGGVVATGGAVASGGVVGTGGVVGAGGTTTCQPKSRDCTSSLDNDCNGIADNQEITYCTCVVDTPRACQEHPGYDGVGICRAGSQTCAASSDRTTSGWGACSGSMGPSARNCTSSADNDCNGTPDNQETAYCQCPAGNSQSCLPAGMCTAGRQTCVASSDKTTAAWGPCTGYTGPTTLYRDLDGDGYGNPSASAQVCPGTSGYVSNAEDCDDADRSLYPGVSICGTVTQKKSCVGGTPVLQPCPDGCINGECRSDGTIGLPGYVSCGVGSPRCSTSDGCYIGNCGVGSDFPGPVRCDGPNDCNSGTSCCARYIPGGAQSECIAGSCALDYSGLQVCDPLAGACTCASTDINGYPFYTCQ